MRVAIDARYIREKPSGIGVYVRALVDRIPRAAPGDSFVLWAHPLAPRPLSHSPNTIDVTVGPGPNSPLTVWWPERYASLDDVDVPYLVVVGQNSATKRHDAAIAAFAKGVKPPWRLVLVQRQGRRAALRRLARRLDVGARIVWLPSISRGDIVTLLQGAGALVQPSI